MEDYYTLNEAKKILPELKLRTKKIYELRSALDILASIEIKCPECETDHFQESTSVNKKHHELAYRLFCEIEEVEKLGCSFNDLDTCTVDIPSRKDCREISFCWRFGEDDIYFWHDECECYEEERKPLKIPGKARESKLRRSSKM